MELISTNVTVKNSSGSWDVTIGSAASGDVIVVAIALSSNANVGSGFTTAGYTARGGSMNPNMLFYTKTAGASEPTTVNCTVSSFANAYAIAMIWRGCSVDSASSTFNTVASTTTKTHTAPTITPTADQSVVLSIGYFNNSYLSPALETVSPLANYAFASSQIMVATEWIETAAASTAFTWESTQTSAQTGNFGCIVLNNTSGQPRYIGCTNTHERIIKPYGYGTAHTFAAPNVLQGGAAYNGVRAWGTSDKKYTVRTPLPNSWINGGISLFDNATTNNMSGTVVDFTGSLQDLDGKLLGIAWTVGTSQWTSSTVGAYGLVLSFEDNAGHADHYKLGDTSTAFLSQTQVSFISVGSRTPDVNYGGTVDYTNIKYVGLTYDKTTTAAPTITMSALYAYSGATVFVGGGSAAPIDAEAIYNGLTGYLGYSGEVAAIQNGRFQGASQLVASIPIQVGDGTIPTYLDLSLQSIDTPRLETRLDDYDCAVGLSGITLYTSSSDTVNLASALIGSVSRQYFKFHASAVAPSSFLAAGATISNRDVTWLTGLACPAMTFDHCYAVDMKDADCTGTVWKSPQDPTTSTFCAASWTVDGATLTGTETDVSGTSADYHIALGASVTAITLTNHTFTNTAAVDKIYTAKTAGTVTAGSFVTGESYEIKTVGTTDFTAIGASANTIGVQFTASGAGSGSGDAYKALKIIKTGTTSLLDTDVTTVDGVKVWVAGDVVTQSVTITGLTSGSRVQIYDTTAATELANSTQASPGSNVTWTSATAMTWTDPVAAAADRTIRVRIAYVSGTSAKGFIEASIGTCGITDGTEAVSYLANQVNDAVYNTNGIDGPSIYATSGITFTDSGSNDRINCNIGGGAVSWGTIYACFAYWMSTSTGIADDIAYVTAVDTANYLLDSLKIKNTSATPLTITGGWGRDATSLTIADCIDTAGSTGNIFPQPDHVVAYATGSGSLTAGDITNIWSNGSRTLTTTIPSASDNANAVANVAVDGSITMAESLRLSNSILGGKVSGAGTGTEVFRSLADDKDRATVTVDSSGNRSVVVRDLT